jgi:hypothetical protein
VVTAAAQGVRNQTLCQAVLDQIGRLSLGELLTKVLVDSFLVDNEPQDPNRVCTWKPTFFNSFQGMDREAVSVKTATDGRGQQPVDKSGPLC